MRLISFLLIILLVYACSRKQEKTLSPDERKAFVQDSIRKVRQKNFENTKINSAEIIRQVLESRQPGERYSVLNDELYASILLPDFYVENGFKPLWIQHYDSLGKVFQMVSFIENAEFHGLDPNHYHLKAITSQLNAFQNDSTLIYNALFLSNLDLLLTDAFFALASHIYLGKVDHENPEAQWGIQSKKPVPALYNNLKKMLSGTSVALAFKRFYPPHPGYEAMVNEAKRLKDFIAGDFTVTVNMSALSIKPGDTTEYLSAIKDKLAFLGLYKPDTLSMAQVYDEKTVEAIKKLQVQYGYNADGAIGRNTLKALNMPVKECISKLYVNMERLRWMPDSLETRYLLVNIADFTLNMFQNNDTLISMRTIVGNNYRETPVFNSRITYLVFSPSWTVPPTIQRDDVIPAVIKDPGYLARKNMIVYNSNGKQVDAGTIDWKRNGMRYTIRQSPGPQNALGKVKFMFPNKHNVYLHDTPTRGLFARDERTFSSGCIRIEKPYELAKILLSDMPGWTDDKIRQAMDSKTDKTVVLKSPVGVYLYYLTAWGNSTGEIHYRTDIYNRDEDILKALKQKSQIQGLAISAVL